ncbi:MAG: WD40 repeat domain-containing protein [Myxococcota bacterium]|nr:WD40 repeat domain-containing protein [Myxococcota bacterium]
MRAALIGVSCIALISAFFLGREEQTPPNTTPQAPGPTQVAGAQITALLVRDAQIISGDAGGRIRVWSRTKQDVKHSWFGHEGPIRTLKNLGSHFASAGADGRVVTWQMDQAIQRVRLKNYRLNDAYFGTDGGIFLAAERGTVARRGTRPNWIHKSIHGQGTFAIDHAPDRPLVASAGTDGFVRIWRADEGTSVSQWRASDSWVTQLAWIGNEIITADAQGEITRWTVKPSGQVLESISMARLNSPVVAMAIHGERLAVSTADRHVRIYHWIKGIRLHGWRCDTRPAMAIAINAQLVVYGDGHGNIIQRAVKGGQSIGMLPAITRGNTPWDDLPKN